MLGEFQTKERDMAEFKSHLFVSSMLGLGYGAAGHTMYETPVPTCLLAGGLCAVSGMLPDVDSNSGRPLQESLAFGAAIVPMMLGEHLKMFGASAETIVLTGVGVYLFVRFGFGWFIKKFTKHRGMFHSIPAALIFGEFAFLLASGSVEMRLFKAGGVVLGYTSHLLLDELYSFETKRGKLHVKKSLGTGLKFFSSKSLGATFMTYTALTVLTLLATQEPNWMHDIRERHREMAEEASQEEGETVQIPLPDSPAPFSDGADHHQAALPDLNPFE